MKKLLFVGLSVMILLSLAFSSAATACACKCADLYACMERCKHFFIDPVLQTACYGGCLIACKADGAT